jgi:GNAT superfamily N-acetyltransferase
MPGVVHEGESREASSLRADATASTYPHALECDLVTSTGVKLHLRPIKASDAPRLQRFHEQLSESAIFRRFFSLHLELSARELEHLTTLDYKDRFAYVVLDDVDEFVAVGRYDRIEGTTDAEVAFVVIDHFQHHGIGILLLWHLARAARPNGITHFVAETQADNRGMLGVFRDSGYPITSTIDAEIVSLRFPILSTPESHAHFLRRTTLFEPEESNEEGPS